MQLCHPIEEKFGGEHVQNTWHDVNSLSDPEMLLEAVSAALAADVIVVSVYAADKLPPEFAPGLTSGCRAGSRVWARWPH